MKESQLWYYVVGVVVVMLLVKQVPKMNFFIELSTHSNVQEKVSLNFIRETSKGAIFKITNLSDYDIKNIETECDFISRSGVVLETEQFSIFDIFKSNVTRLSSGINITIPNQINKIECLVTDFEIIGKAPNQKNTINK